MDQAITAPIIIAFTITGGKHASAFIVIEFLLSCPIRIVISAAINVAYEPTTTSSIPYGLSKFAIKQPANKPSVVYGKKNGKMHRASAMRNWTGPNDTPAPISVNAI